MVLLSTLGFDYWVSEGPRGARLCDISQLLFAWVREPPAESCFATETYFWLRR